MLKARNDARPKGQKAAAVVAREKVAVLSKGTLIDAEMVAAKPNAIYTMAGVCVCACGVGGWGGGGSQACRCVCVWWMSARDTSWSGSL